MPHYFFDVRDGTITHDRDGTDLADLDAARAVAVEILNGLPRRLPCPGSFVDQEVTVRTEDGRRLFKTMLTLRCIELA